MKDNIVLSYDMTFLFDGSEERVSPSITRLKYQHSTPPSPPSLYTPAVTYDWTIIDIDTSQKGEVKLSVESYRRGNFINDRQHETETKIIKSLSMLKERANQSLQATPKSGAPEL